jgi:hypothetical protein
MTAAVSYEAQWRLVYRDKHELAVSYVQAAIPDLGSLVFACFDIGLALHGRRAIRARLLNVLCIGISITMNALGCSTLKWPHCSSLIWPRPGAVAVAV